MSWIGTFSDNSLTIVFPFLSLLNFTIEKIEDIACGTPSLGDFEVFCQVLFTDFPSMGLDLKLDGSTWTVFLPTDGAFDKYSTILEPLIGESSRTSNLFWETHHAGLNLMAYHFHNGDAFRVSQLECSELLEMSTGESSRHKCLKGERYQKGQGNHMVEGLPFPKIIKRDIEFCHGIVHIVDGVMLPSDFEDAALTFNSNGDLVVDPNVPITMVEEEESSEEFFGTNGDVSNDFDESMDTESAEGCVEPDVVYAVVNRFQIRRDNNCVEDWVEATKNNAIGARTKEKGALRFGT